tara:strand:+ start:150 stop:479 length:330 start_codon:yes stop_codon:yes gene_type:complete
MGKKAKQTVRKPLKRKRKRKKSMKLSISKERYKRLVSKKMKRQRMTPREKKLLNDALYIKYCRCLKALESKDYQSKTYPICMNSVYKRRKVKPPYNAARRCSQTFYVDK